MGIGKSGEQIDPKRLNKNWKFLSNRKWQNFRKL